MPRSSCCVGCSPNCGGRGDNLSPNILCTSICGGCGDTGLGLLSCGVCGMPPSPGLLDLPNCGGCSDILAPVRPGSSNCGGCGDTLTPVLLCSSNCGGCSTLADCLVPLPCILLLLGGLLGDVPTGDCIVLGRKNSFSLGCLGSSSFLLFFLSMASCLFISDGFGPIPPVLGAAAPPPSTW